jgi:hypothetical protein
MQATLPLTVLALVVVLTQALPRPPEQDHTRVYREALNITGPAAKENRKPGNSSKPAEHWPAKNESRRSIARPEARTDATRERRSCCGTPAVSPQSLTKGAVSIIIQWDTREYGGWDLDSVMMDPWGCILAPKGGGDAYCDNFPTWSQIGGCYNAIYFTPWDALTTQVYNCPLRDSTGATTPNGAEEITILYGDSSMGSYKHLIYQAQDDYGFSQVLTTEYRIWSNNVNNWPAVAYGPYSVMVDDTYMDCFGRFFNTFSLLLDVQDDDATITTFSPTFINSISTTPNPSFGTTDTFAFEAELYRTSSESCVE